MKHSQIRQHIIEISSQLFYNQGYNNTGINEIISKAGIAKATLYNHFKSKEEICLAYLRFKNSTFLKDIRDFCNQQPEGKDRVLGIFEFLKAFFKERDFNGCWCIKTVSEIPKENEVIRNEIKMQKQLLIDFIESLILENLNYHSNSESESLARKTYLLYEGAVAESHLHQTDWPIIEGQSVCDTILR